MKVLIFIKTLILAKEFLFCLHFRAAVDSINKTNTSKKFKHNSSKDKFKDTENPRLTLLVDLVSLDQGS